MLHDFETGATEVHSLSGAAFGSERFIPAGAPSVAAALANMDVRHAAADLDLDGNTDVIVAVAGPINGNQSAVLIRVPTTAPQPPARRAAGHAARPPPPIRGMGHSRSWRRGSTGGRSRTLNLLIRSQMLYPIELRPHASQHFPGRPDGGPSLTQ